VAILGDAPPEAHSNQTQGPITHPLYSRGVWFAKPCEPPLFAVVFAATPFESTTPSKRRLNA
jgi:hypothetical protein